MLSQIIKRLTIAPRLISNLTYFMLPPHPIRTNVGETLRWHLSSEFNQDYLKAFWVRSKYRPHSIEPINLALYIFIKHCTQSMHTKFGGILSSIFWGTHFWYIWCPIWVKLKMVLYTSTQIRHEDLIGEIITELWPFSS